MPAAYPAAIPVLPRPSAITSMSAAGYSGPEVVDALADEVEAIATTLGVNALAWQTYSPSRYLHALGGSAGAIVHPDLGSGGNQWLRYARAGGLVYYQGLVQFGTGAAQGTADAYAIPLPVRGNRSIFGHDRPFGTAWLGTTLHGGTLPASVEMADDFGSLSGEGSDAGSRYMVMFCGGPLRRRGAVSVASGAQSVDVTHGLPYTPVDGDVQVTPAGSWATSGLGRWWVSNIGATTFRINATTAAGGNLTGSQAFHWHASPGVAYDGSGTPGPAWVRPNMPWPWATNYYMLWSVVYEAFPGA